MTAVKRSRSASPSQTNQESVGGRPLRLDRRKLARECAKLDATVEKAIAEEGLSEDVSEWPEY
jgi:hypothetical protein